MTEIEYDLCILNLRYKIRGFDALRDLKLWLDEHASECVEDDSIWGDARVTATTPVPEATPLSSTNGGAASAQGDSE